jgi:hypothetical protein
VSGYRKKGAEVRVVDTRELGQIYSRQGGGYWVILNHRKKPRFYRPDELESVRHRNPVRNLTTSQSHEFEMSAVQEYCKVCTLPRGNAVHSHVAEKTVEEVKREKYGEK